MSESFGVQILIQCTGICMLHYSILDKMDSQIDVNQNDYFSVLKCNADFNNTDAVYTNVLISAIPDPGPAGTHTQWHPEKGWQYGGENERC